MVLLNSGEEVICRARRHWFVIFLEFLFLLVMATAPALLQSFIPFLGGLFFFAYSLWLVAVWILGFVAWTNFYLDVWIITNQRVIDIEQKGFFHREVASCHLEDVQDITTNIAGLIPTLLNYGDLRIQTAGESREFLLTLAARPDFVKQKINEAKQKARG